MRVGEHAEMWSSDAYVCILWVSRSMTCKQVVFSVEHGQHGCTFQRMQLDTLDTNSKEGKLARVQALFPQLPREICRSFLLESPDEQAAIK